jgi:probable rRNA maturation factor
MKTSQDRTKVGVDVAFAGTERLPRGTKRAIIKQIRAVVDASGLLDTSVSLAFVDDAEMTALNRRWRKKRTTTDVLSFSALEGERVLGSEGSFGDIVINVPQAQRQANEHGHSLSDEMAVLCAHAILHLLGLDHERSDDEARLQAECEMTILDAAGLRPEIALLGRSFYA